MNFYSFHIGDYLSATRHLSWTEDAAFRRLLDTYYVTEKPIPTDLRQAYRLVMATTEDQREAVKIILEEFFHLTECGWINHRADDEISIMREKQQKQRDKANKRWHCQVTEHGTASALPQHKESHATASNIDANAMPPIPIPIPIPIPSISTDVDIKEKRAPRFDAQAHLVSIGVDELVAGDWIKHRRTVKAAPSLTAIDGIAKESERAGISLSDALAMCCQRGWRGFKAEWIADKPINGKTQRQLDSEATTRAIFGNMLTPIERVISGEVVK